MIINMLSDKIKEYMLSNNNLIRELNLRKDIEVKFLAQGEYNINFTISDGFKKYVFRVNTKSQLELDNQIIYEYNALKSLEKSDVTPKVYYVDDKKDFFKYGILIMEFLEGRPLDYSRDLEKAAFIFGKIHSLDLNKINIDSFIVEENIFIERINEGKRLLSDYLKSNIVDSANKNFFYKFINYLENNLGKEKYFKANKFHVINNTEVNSHNFIIGQRNYLIDWEKPVISDPCQDLTQFLAPTTTLWKANYLLSKDEIRKFYKLYKRYNKALIDIEERVKLYNPYLLFRALSWCAYAYIEYQKNDKEIKNIDTYKKINEYLDIYFMKNLLKDYFI